ncbi:hypothetical protein BKA66DRAFT_566394 [Pyrenochaeta sp. MPI-SDFR-AT-0127]|nr:hypothetical protein BKA66DRAFT_566394 [Pyrenochaeta sp. MPI-SDFR-AT-0127]
MFHTIKNFRLINFLPEKKIFDASNQIPRASTTSSNRLNCIDDYECVSGHIRWETHSKASKGHYEFYEVDMEASRRVERKEQPQVAFRPLATHQNNHLGISKSLSKAYHALIDQIEEPMPKLSYLESLPEPEPNEDHVERQKFVRDRLSSMVSEERMQLGLGYPSGHSGIDSVIAEYNQQKAISALWDKINAQEAERKEIELNHIEGRNRYKARVEQLAYFGPKLSNGIDMFELALQENNMDVVVIVVRDIITNILMPIDAIFKNMDNDVSLEEEGARILKEQWPIGRLENVYIFLRNQCSFSVELLHFLQGIEAICTPLDNPLGPRPVLVATSPIS